jgi:hypothetical protein
MFECRSRPPQLQMSQARTSDWKLVRLFLYCVVLSAVAAVFSAVFALVPYWLWPEW